LSIGTLESHLTSTAEDTEDQTVIHVVQCPLFHVVFKRLDRFKQSSSISVH